MESSKVQKNGLSLEAMVPEEARGLTEELLAAFAGNATHAMLKLTTGLAAAAILRDAALLRALSTTATSLGHTEARTRATEAAMHALRPSSEGTRDAVIRLVSAALERGLRMAPTTRPERVDPLLAACTDIVELVSAISTARFIATTDDVIAAAENLVQTPPPSSVEQDRGGPKRRVTRDFEMMPPSMQSTERAALPRTEPRAEPRTEARSTMRPAPPRSTMRPTARGTLRPPPASGEVDTDAVLIPKTQVRDAHGRPLRKKW